MTKSINKDSAIKTLSSIIRLSLTTNSVKDNWGYNYSCIINLKQRKTSNVVLNLASGNSFDVRAVIRLTDVDIQIRLYLDDEVVSDMVYHTDNPGQIVRESCRIGFTSYNSFHKDMVDAESVEDFINRYYRPERITDTLVDTYKERFNSEGFCFISHHDSRTGSIVSYYGK